MRYVIIGAGAVGAALAAEFHRAGIDYVLVARGAQLEHIRKHGLTYVRPSGRKILPLNTAGQDEVELRPDDVLVITVKTQDVIQVVEAWADRPVHGGGTAARLPVLTVQNGLETERIVARRFPHVYAASILVPAVFIETGTVTVASQPQMSSLTIGRFPSGLDDICGLIACDFRKANSLVEARSDIVRWKAAKLLHNVKNVLELFSGDEDILRDAGERIVDEAETVLRAAGFDPAAHDERRLDISGWKPVRHLIDAPTGQSTWQSFTRGARSEIDYLNGEIALLGVLTGHETPWNRAAQLLAAELSARRGRPGDLSVDQLVQLALSPSCTPAFAHENAAAAIIPVGR